MFQGRENWPSFNSDLKWLETSHTTLQIRLQMIFLPSINIIMGGCPNHWDETNIEGMLDHISSPSLEGMERRVTLTENIISSFLSFSFVLLSFSFLSSSFCYFLSFLLSRFFFFFFGFFFCFHKKISIFFSLLYVKIMIIEKGRYENYEVVPVIFEITNMSSDLNITEWPLNF